TPLGYTHFSLSTTFDYISELDEGKFLIRGEVGRLIRVCKRRAKSRKAGVRDWLIIHLALSTGLRVHEITDLKCGDILIANERASLIVRNGKGGKRRIVRFNGEFKKHLKDYLAWKKANNEGINPEDPLIKSSNTGGHLSKRAVQRAFERCSKMAGIDTKHCFHHLRHTYASHLYKASDYNLRMVQKQLGHSSIKTTQVYADVFDEELDRALERLYMS
ncbi:MAG: tyrosine-type recombinase/integrase, partial [Planctomycetota bacterium]